MILRRRLMLGASLLAPLAAQSVSPELYNRIEEIAESGAPAPGGGDQ